MTPILCPNPNCRSPLGETDAKCTRCGAVRDVAAVTLDHSTAAYESAIAPTSPCVESQFIGRFEIGEPLGEGSFGIVYRAFDPHLNREVALKVAKPAQLGTPQRVQRFLQEARSAAKLTHPNIVFVHDAGQDGEHYFIAQRFVNGTSLDRVLDGNRSRT